MSDITALVSGRNADAHHIGRVCTTPIPTGSRVRAVHNHLNHLAHLCLTVDFLQGCGMWGGKWRLFVRGWRGGCLEHLVLLGWLAVDMRV